MARFTFIAIALTLLLCARANAAEETCQLRRAAELDAKLAGSDHLFLPAEFGARKVRLLLDTGGAWSVMKERLAKELGLRPEPLRTVAFVDVAGGEITHYVIVKSFKLGPITFPRSDFLVIPQASDDNIEYWGGTIGMERLSDFNVEIDNLTKTVTLYYPDRYCSGRLVSWPTPTVEIPFKFNDGTPQLRVTVHDETVQATFDTGSSDTLMDLDLARRAFGLTPESPGMRSHGEQTMLSGKKLAFYSYTFKTLTVSGLTFENVDVTLGDFENAPLVLGMTEISQLHLYIAFGRKIIYASRVDGK